MPKLSYYQKAGEPGPLERVEDEKGRQNILKAVQAIEMHMVMSCIAMGILQSVSIYWVGKLSPGQLRYQKTASRGRVSEAALMVYLRKYLFLFMENSQICR